MNVNQINYNPLESHNFHKKTTHYYSTYCATTSVLLRVSPTYM